MKKFFVLCLTILLFPVLAFAEAESLASVYVIDNNSAALLVTYVPVTTIMPGFDKIVDVNAVPMTSTALPMVALWDSTLALWGTSAITLQMNFAEIEQVANTMAEKLMFYPKELKYGLRVVQGAYTSVRIIYTR